MKDGARLLILSVMLRILRIGNQIQTNMYAVTLMIRIMNFKHKKQNIYLKKMIRKRIEL